jgi:enoyl-CoA hydratase
MAELVTYDRTDLVSTLTMDDGKVNVFSIPMLRTLHEAFDQAERDETVVLLRGRPGYFSAGFDLGVFKGPQKDAILMLTLGATLAQRILSFPAPVAVACTGHAFPAGAFLLMAADTRIGADGPFKLGLNEVRIGLTLPWFAIVLARHRLAPAHFDHATVTGTMFDPPGAREAGILDAVADPEELDGIALSAAEDLASLDRHAHAATKLRVRQSVLEELRSAIESELSGSGQEEPAHTGHPTPSGP